MTGRKGRSGRKPKILTDFVPVVVLPPAQSTEPPGWLGEVAREKFVELVATIKRLGKYELTDYDVDAIAAYSEAWQDFHDAQKSIDANGAEIWGVDAQGNRTCKANPAVRRKNQAAIRIRHGMQRFGLTPMDRMAMKIGTGEPKKTEDFGDFLGDVASA